MSRSYYRTIIYILYFKLFTVISRRRKNKCPRCYNDIHLLCIFWYVECFIIPITRKTGCRNRNIKKPRFLRCGCIKCNWSTCCDISTTIAVYLSDRSINVGWSHRTSTNHFVRIFCDRGKNTVIMIYHRLSKPQEHPH